MKKIYIAGSLFTEKEIFWRLHEEALLNELLMKEGLKDKVSIYNPINNKEINNKKTDTPITPSDIFWGDTQRILESDYILLDADDISHDDGIATELGLIIQHNMNYSNKKIHLYSHISDMRQDTRHEEGMLKSWGHNLYSFGGMLENGGQIFRTSDDAIKMMVKDIKKDLENN